MIKAQQKLYQIILEFEMNRSSTYWNYVMGKRSFYDFEHDPLHEEMNKKISKLNKAKCQLNKLDGNVRSNLYALQKTYSNCFTLAHELQNYSCLNNGYIDCYGNIHNEYQPYPNEESKCYQNMTPRRKIPKYDRVKASFLRKKHRYQRAKLDLDTDRELEKMKYSNSNLPKDENTHMFQNVSSYHNKRLQRKLHSLESKLKMQFDQHIQADKERQNLSRKLHLLNEQEGYHQTKSNLAKRLSENITAYVWNEKELVRNKRKISKLRQRQGYSRVERAFMALDEDPIFTNVSTSVIHPSNSDKGDDNNRVPPATASATTIKPSRSGDDEDFSLNSELIKDYKRDQILQAKLKEDLARAELNATQLMTELELERAKYKQETKDPNRCPHRRKQSSPFHC
jgi:hypothetical protein